MKGRVLKSIKSEQEWEEITPITTTVKEEEKDDSLQVLVYKLGPKAQFSYTKTKDVIQISLKQVVCSVDIDKKHKNDVSLLKKTDQTLKKLLNAMYEKIRQDMIDESDEETQGLKSEGR